MTATDYVETLASVYVQADAQARKAAIQDQIAQIGAEMIGKLLQTQTFSRKLII
ncbi:Uncharacterised protein [Weissella viridescens]|uniref:Uncharacterized protein n=1 Tax=Weissella viridescens TaxID=1629 RepID=A0A380P919_WEIVI|nr:Uncharacterised protein [Weissella viridescens]